MINAFGPSVGHKATHPQTGDVTLACEGFNGKNHYDRETPCDKDYLRKMSKDTDADLLTSWFNGAVASMWKQRRAFDQAGLFIGDASYLFVPDNERYEGSARLLFNDKDKPVSRQDLEKMPPEQRSRCRLRRCYKLVSLVHTDRRRRFCMMVGVRLVSGKHSECPVFYQLLDEFVAAVGKGVVRRLLLDRAFLDGAQIARCKVEHGIDVLIPLRSNMVLWHDVMGLLNLHRHRWGPYTPVSREEPVPRSHSSPPEAVVKRERARQRKLAERKAAEPPPSPDKTVVRSEVASFGYREWEECQVPLHVIVNRDHYADGHEETWMLVDTRPLNGQRAASERRAEYSWRNDIEERHRQIKCFWDLGSFTSTALSLIVNQIVFVLLVHNLLQWFLLRRGRPGLNRKTPQRLRDQLRATRTVVIIYCEQRYVTLSPLAFAELCMILSEEVKPKALGKIRDLRKQLDGELRKPRPP